MKRWFKAMEMHTVVPQPSDSKFDQSWGALLHFSRPPMVVLLPVEGFSSSVRPPLFGILHHEGVAVATLRVEEYHFWTLRATCIHAVTSLVHKRLEGRWFPTLAAAAQFVFGEIIGGRTEYMRTVRLYLRGDLPDMIANAPAEIKILAHEPLAEAHISARVQCYPSELGGGCWLPIGKGRPFIPHEMPRSAALNPSLWSAHSPSSNGGPTPRLAAAAAAESGNVPVDAGDEGASRATDDGEAPPRKRRRKKHHRQPLIEVGAVVWDGVAMSVPPVPLVIREVHEDQGDVTRSYSLSLFLETFDPEPRRLWRSKLEVSNFDANLRMIYQERRMLLEAEGVWDHTVASVKRALLQRLLMARGRTMSDLWTHPRLLAMGDEACPITDEEAAAWLASGDEGRCTARVSTAGTAPSLGDRDGAGAD